MDLNRELRSAIGTGKVAVGTNETVKAVKKGSVKLVILTRNCPESTIKKIGRKKGTPVYRFDGTNMELGAACGKPFPISILSIMDPGASDILVLEKEAVVTESAKKAVKKTTKTTKTAKKAAKKKAE